MANPARKHTLKLLQAWERGSTYAADLINAAIKQNQIPNKYRGTVQQLLYSVIRNQRLLDHLSNHFAEGKLDPNTRRVLRLGLAEVYLLGSAEHALVNETVELAKWSKPVVNAILRRAIEEKESVLAGFDNLDPQVRWSIPKFLWKRWKKEFGEEQTIALAKWNNQPSDVYLRVNPLKGEPDEVFGSDEVERLEGFPDHVKVTGDLPKEWLDAGWVYAQDPSTNTAIELLDPQPGESILDACAAPGGKTLAIAARMRNEGKISATDSSIKRLERLEKNLKRLRVFNAQLHQHDWFVESTDAPENHFDRILLDVPCSNTGVIRRRIDVPWRLKRTQFDELAKIQLAMLKNASNHLKPGGRLVYSTCSIDSEENEDITQAFLEERPEFQQLEERRIRPWKDGYDGAYAVAFTR